MKDFLLRAHEDFQGKERYSQIPSFSIPCVYVQSISSPLPASFILHAIKIVVEMGVDLVKHLPVESGASPVEVAVVELGHAVTDHVARKAAGGGEPRHRCFQQGRALEEGFVRMAEDG